MSSSVRPWVTLTTMTYLSTSNTDFDLTTPVKLSCWPQYRIYHTDLTKGRPSTSYLDFRPQTSPTQVEALLYHRQDQQVERLVVVSPPAESSHWWGTSIDSPILSRVPQDTVLEPLMFLVYVNDIGAKISPHKTIKLFADDAVLYRTIDKPSDELQLRHDLDTMTEWSNTWILRFHAKKCHPLKITRQRKPLQTLYNTEGSNLEEVQHHPYLGVKLTSDLTCKTHTCICNISGKANIILNFL